jgi:3-methyl-2-oxobutanoate hydroxymethyltransferase
MNKLTLTTLRRMKENGEKIAVLTAYDAIFAKTLETAGVDVLLVGDSLGMVVQGQDSTLPVTVDDMIYHTKLVTRVTQRAFVVTDMPFMSYRTKDLAIENAGDLMKYGGAQMVKLEGGEQVLETVAAMTQVGIPVCAHLGLLPQSVYKLGGYKVQGRDEATATSILNDAIALQQAGADMLVVECVPKALAAKLTETLEIPVIGIGAGVHCDGQVLVVYDLLGLGEHKRPKFVHDFLKDQGSISAAVSHYVTAVKAGDFPDDEHSFE